MEEKMKNIRIMTAKIITFFAQLNFFSTMNKCKNFAKLVICAFAISGLVACSGGGGGDGGSTGGGTDPIDITISDTTNQAALAIYTLEDIGDTLVTAIETAITANSATDITVVIANSSDASTEIAVNGDNWKTIAINFPDLTDGSNSLTITVTYVNEDGAVATETTATLTISYDGTLPEISSFTEQSTLLPITDNAGFTFDIVFSENINTSTFTVADFTISSSIAIITNIAFNGATATITATTDIPANQTGNLTISVGNQWEDLAGNEANSSQAQELYDIDVQLPTVLSVENKTAGGNDYLITYTFSEEVVGITASNFVITAGSQTIIPTNIQQPSVNTVTFTVTSSINEITIRATGFTDADQNVGLEHNSETLNLGAITVTSANRMIGDDDITPKGNNNYTFVLSFTADVSAEEFTIADFTTTDTNIQIVSITPTTDLKEFTIEFKFVDDNNTANANITIVAGAIENADQTNDQPIVISIDRGPRIVTLDGGSVFNKQQIGTDNAIAYTFTFSEAIDKASLIASDFEINPANSGVSATTVSFPDDKTGAVTFTVDANNVDGTFSIALPDDSYTDQANNENRETTGTEANAVLPIDITIDNIAPTVTSPAAGNYEVPTQSFNITIEFSEELQLTAVLDGNVPILTESNITLTNATTTDSITIENSAGKGRVVIEATIADLSGERPTITISGDSYSDTLGNTGESDYTLTIDIATLLLGWLTNGNCQNFSFDDGDGEINTPYQISNICQLQNIADDDLTAGGVSYTDLLDKNYILIADIDASYTRNWNSEQGFNPIGGQIKQYTGTFDGNGYAIHNLYINRPNIVRVALFGINDENSEIKYLAVVHSYIVGFSNVGGIVGQVQGTVRASAVSGSISGTENVGGLFGEQNSGGKAKENNISSVSVKTTMNIAGILIGQYVDNASLFASSLNNNIGVGSVVGNNSVGIVGLQQLSSSTFNNNLGLASINSGNTFKGGLIGQQQVNPPTMNNYWNTEVSGQAQGIGNVTDHSGTTGVTSDAITDSEAILSGLGFTSTGAYDNIDEFSYPVLKDNALDATEQTIFIAHGLFRLATTDNAVITDQSVSNKVSNFLGKDNIQDDITLTASDFSANSALTVIDTNLEASNDINRVDYFACVDGGTEDILKTTTVGNVAVSVKKASGTLSVQRTLTANGPAHGCQLELPTAPSAGDKLNLDVTFTKATAGETCETPDADGYYRRMEEDTTTLETQPTIYFCSYTRRFNITFE